MHTEQTCLLETTLRIPGAHITRRDLVFDPGIATDALPAIGGRILAVRGYGKWALGAVLCEMRGRGVANAGETGDASGDWATHWADVNGVDPKERREIMGVYTFYPAASRTADLSWEHYREAMLGVCDGKPRALPRALDYLRLAEEQQLSVSGLRRHIRTAQATEQPTAKQTEIAEYSAVFDFRRYAAREVKQIESYTKERAELVLADIGDETCAFIDALRRIAWGEDPTPDKESPAVPILGRSAPSQGQSA